ncbi:MULTISPECIES: DNA primase [unclassified Lacrimispora]|uniref:DNA primase n=1 Tax=unclassified Lacrimispora TaxID=2719232 RepID=UPI00376FD1FD
MRYSEEVIEEVRMKNDIVDVISGYVKLQKKGSNYFGLCPFHNEKSPSFSVSPAKQMYYCFGCGAGGNVLTFIMEYENYSFSEALKVLADRSGVKLPVAEYSKEAREQEDLRSTLLEVNKLAASYFYYQLKNPQGEAGYRYLRDRQLSDETITRFGLGYSNKTSDDLYRYLKGKGYDDGLLKQSGLVTIEERGTYDKFWNRVMFPIMDVNNRVIGFGGRVMGAGEPKYLNSPETKLFDKSRNLYGLNYARLSREKYILICEGYMDVIAMHQAGFTNAVASLGTAFTTQHAQLLKRYTDKVVLTYDSDGAGVKAALRAIPILKEAGISIRVLNMQPYKDPDEFIKNLGAEEFRKRIEEARNSFLFEIDVLKKNYKMDDPEQKTEFYNQVARKLLEFPEALERENYLEAVSREYYINYEDLKRLVNRLGASLGPSVAQREEEGSLKSQRKKEKEDGVKQSQRLLLTWLIENPLLFDKIEGVITPDDFIEELYHKVARMVFDGHAAGTLNPAEILNHFIHDEGQYRAVAGLFHASLKESLDNEEQKKAFSETIMKVKKNSLDNASRHAAGILELQNIIKEQAALKDLHISLD